MGRRKKTTAEFIDEAKRVHHDRYDYSITEFFRSDQSVWYICPVHGQVKQMACNHLRGYGCNQCGVDRQRLNREDFVAKARNVHEDGYDYSCVHYHNTMTKVKVICPKHGPFCVTPSKHLNGCGCPTCANKHVTTEQFIAKCKAVHGERYDYSFVEYHPGYTKVRIICPQHGSFFQTTYNHLSNKQGCPACKHEKAKNNIGMYGPALFETNPETKTSPITIYLIQCTSQHEAFFKVGLTKHLQTRIYSLPYTITVIVERELPLHQAFTLEQFIKEQYHCFIPEQHFSGWTECLMLTKKDIDDIKQMIQSRSI